jgi:nucleoside-triphosphatase THEP1
MIALMPPPRILATGPPGVGKTTVVLSRESRDRLPGEIATLLCQ